MLPSGLASAHSSWSRSIDSGLSMLDQRRPRRSSTSGGRGGGGALQRRHLRLGVGREVGEEAQLEHGAPGAVLEVERHGAHHPRRCPPGHVVWRDVGRPCKKEERCRRPLPSAPPRPSSGSPTASSSRSTTPWRPRAPATTAASSPPRTCARTSKARALRDRIAQETYEAGHHTTLQHATFQFALENVSRQAIWSFLHSHPFYNSEQVSQRYVEVKPGNVIVPALPERAARRSTAAAVEAAMGAYQRLIALLHAQGGRGVLPASSRRAQAHPGEVGGEPQEEGAGGRALRAAHRRRFAHLYHTVSGLTLHRYHRLCQQLDVPDRDAADGRGDGRRRCSRLDPLFFRNIEDPLPLEETLEYRALSELGPARGRRRSGAAYLREFDAGLGAARARGWSTTR